MDSVKPSSDRDDRKSKLDDGETGNTAVGQPPKMQSQCGQQSDEFAFSTGSVEPFLEWSGQAPGCTGRSISGDLVAIV